MAVSLIGALSPLGISAASLACQPLSKLVGRVQIRWGRCCQADRRAAACQSQVRLGTSESSGLVAFRPPASKPAWRVRVSCHGSLCWHLSWQRACCRPSQPLLLLLPPSRRGLQPVHPLVGHRTACLAGLPAHLHGPRPAGGCAPPAHGSGQCDQAPHALRWEGGAGVSPGEGWPAGMQSVWRAQRCPKSPSRGVVWLCATFHPSPPAGWVLAKCLPRTALGGL